MATLTDALARLAADLTAAGLPATTDPRNFHPPAVLVLWDTVTPRTSCMARADVRLLAVAPGPSHGDALAWLDDAVAAIWSVIRPVEARMSVVEHPGTGAQLLGAELVHTLDYRYTPDTP